jgi:hypothetical protein
MKKIKIGFSDFWNGFNPEIDNIFGLLLKKYFEVEYDNINPDFLFFSIHGDKHKSHNCTKILFTPENFYSHKYGFFNYELGKNNFKKYSDYSITSFEIDDDTNFRMPCYIRRYGFDIVKEIENRQTPTKTKKILFLHQNCVLFRDNFVKKLQKYIEVDCPGRCLNNKNIVVNDKIELLKDYKFVLSFENSSSPFYNNDKILDGFISKSLPIYWGDPRVEDDFNPDSFLNYSKFDTEERLIERIIYLNENEEEFLKTLSINPLKNYSIFNESYFINFLNKIF